MELIQK